MIQALRYVSEVCQLPVRFGSTNPVQTARPKCRPASHVSIPSLSLGFVTNGQGEVVKTYLTHCQLHLLEYLAASPPFIRDTLSGRRFIDKHGEMI